MNKNIILAAVLLMNLLIACKKQSAEDETESKPAAISTVELGYAASTSVYGSDLTFKIKFDAIGSGDKAVDQYGILFISWISDETEKIPVSGNAAIMLIHDTPVAGAIIEKKVTLTYEQFNDANYRAFVRLKDGTYLYGEVLYFAKA